MSTPLRENRTSVVACEEETEQHTSEKKKSV